MRQRVRGPSTLFVACVLGAYRRQPPTRLSFNLVETAWATATAGSILRIGAATHPTAGTKLWLWALIAVAASAALNSVAVTCVVSLSTRRSQLGGLALMIAYSVAAALTSACFAILVISAARASLTAGLVALVPFAGSFLVPDTALGTRR